MDAPLKTIVILGQPNAGKSTLFNVLSDIKISTSNFSGTSVDVAECTISVLGEDYKIVDLPGSYSLNPSDKAEEVTVNYILKEEVDLIINVVDATLLARNLELTFEILELGIPFVVALNMHEEAKDKGLEIYSQKFSEIIGVPVYPITALFGKGVKLMIEKSTEYINNTEMKSNEFKFSKSIENHINSMREIINSKNIIGKAKERFYAIKSLENPKVLSKELQISTADERNKIEATILEANNHDLFESFSYERHHLAMKVAEQISKFIKKDSLPFVEKLDRYLLSPYTGYPLLLVFLGLLFTVVFYGGDFLTKLIDPGVQLIPKLYAPLKLSMPFLHITIDGFYQGIAGGIGIVLPYFIPLILLTSFFEETGYISRIAFLVDVFMHKIGLHGKSVAAFILGTGCSIPAIYATRILENRRDRTLTAILIPFIPCSARTAVILALSAAFAGPIWAVVIYLFVIFVIAIIGKILSKFLKRPTGLIMEIPDLKMPNGRVTVMKTWYKLQDFLREALPYLIAGSVLLGWIEYFHVSKYLNIVFSPLIHSVLGLPEQLGSTLIFGFLRKELILIMASQAMGVSSIELMPLSVNQVVVFLVFVTLYFPCVTTFFVLWKEFSPKIAWASAGLSVIVATISAVIFKIFLDIANILF